MGGLFLATASTINSEIWNPKAYVDKFWQGYGSNAIFTSIVKFDSPFGRLQYGKGSCIVTTNSVGFDFVSFQDAWIAEVQPSNRSFVIGVPDGLGDKGGFSMRIETHHSEPLDSDFRITCQNNHRLGSILLLSSFPAKVLPGQNNYYKGKFFVNKPESLPASIQLQFPDGKTPLDIRLADSYLKAVSLWGTFGKKYKYLHHCELSVGGDAWLITGWPQVEYSNVNFQILYRDDEPVPSYKIQILYEYEAYTNNYAKLK